MEGGKYGIIRIKSNDTIWIANFMESGTKFLDYEVASLLGKGGMGEVYLVRRNGEYYALKLLSPSLAQSKPEYVKRFFREGNIAMRLSHPNLVAVHDVGYNAEAGLYYIVMDYVNGYDLRSAIALGGAMPPNDAVGIISSVASALAAGEVLGLVHRDIKPENIMVETDGTVKLLDLGVAKARGTDSLNTMQRTVFGTPNYISPEQAQDASKVDSRADIYSLGIVLYELLAGKHPYGSDKPKDALVTLLSSEELPDIREKHPEVPEKLAALLKLMLAKNPAKRIESASKLLVILKKLGYAAPARPPAGQGARRPSRPDFSYSALSAAKPNPTLSFETKDKEILAFVKSVKAKSRRERRLRIIAFSLVVLLVIVGLLKLVL